MISPVKGRITGRFGNRIHPVTKTQSFHNGVDIAVAIGTPVLAPETGRVTEVWNHDKGGKCMAMVSQSGIRFGFAHLSEQLKKTGDSVNMGDTIALSGNTGASTGPHVHFTVKKNGSWVDPLKYFNFK